MGGGNYNDNSTKTSDGINVILYARYSFKGYF